MCVLDEIRSKREEIHAIAKRHKAEKLWVFGSCARREERPASDVDLLVKFAADRNEGLSGLLRFEEELKKILNRQVDVVSSSVLPRSLGFAHRVCKEAQLI